MPSSSSSSSSGGGGVGGGGGGGVRGASAWGARDCGTAAAGAEPSIAATGPVFGSGTWGEDIASLTGPSGPVVLSAIRHLNITRQQDDALQPASAPMRTNEIHSSGEWLQPEAEPECRAFPDRPGRPEVR